MYVPQVELKSRAGAVRAEVRAVPLAIPVRRQLAGYALVVPVPDSGDVLDDVAAFFLEHADFLHRFLLHPVLPLLFYLGGLGFLLAGLCGVLDGAGWAADDLHWASRGIVSPAHFAGLLLHLATARA